MGKLGIFVAAVLVVLAANVALIVGTVYLVKVVVF